ncbi:MAG: class II fumarate hydratase [Acidimicrobiales bacterium]|nr:class II fumarate hydratase [Acidimicrobiales bacterium]
MSDAAGDTRTESDALGTIEVPADRLWGAQTQRALTHFAVGTDRMPIEVIRAYAVVKLAAARVNVRDGRLPEELGALIERACQEVLNGTLDDEFPIGVFQSGSGTPTNMNVNEVIANRANVLAGGALGAKEPVHPNDHVNMAQSTNDTFPTAMHVAAVDAVTRDLLPALGALREALDAKARAWADVVKIGRTHLQDATPITVGQELSGHVAQLDDAIADVRGGLDGVLRLAIGGTAVGTGLNAPASFGADVSAEIAARTGHPFVPAPNPFAALASIDDIVRLSARLRSLSAALFKLANDMRWLGSGPRAGLGELHLPANEPGSSIMPGKVNPTQAEVLLQVCVAVTGLDTTVHLAGSEGNLQLNVFRPVAIDAVLRAVRLLADATGTFRAHLVEGLEIDRVQLERNVERSVMLVTALTPTIGYDKAAAIAHLAVAEDLPLRDAALASGHISAADFDRIVVPRDLTTPGRPDEA